MIRRPTTYALVVFVAMLSFIAIPAFAQSAAPSKAATTSKASTWTPPRTAWGDPDLEGNWSTDAAYGIPMQRPTQFGTRAELNDQEYKDKANRDKKARETAEKVGDGSIGAISTDAAWLTRTFRQNSLIVEPPDGRLPALTPDGEKRRAAAPRGTYGNGPLDGPEDFTLYDRCITLGVVGSITPKIYGNGHRIAQGPGFVVIMNEMIHEARVIPLDGRPHVGKDIKMYMGDGRGHWERDTLVVETTNLNGKTNYSAEKMTLIERFTRLEPDLLRYEAVINDPTTYTKPFTISIPLTSPPGYQVLQYDCHEGNRAIFQALAGERAEDKALEEDLKKGIIRKRKPVQNGLGVGGSLINEAESR